MVLYPINVDQEGVLRKLRIIEAIPGGGNHVLFGNMTFKVVEMATQVILFGYGAALNTHLHYE